MTLDARSSAHAAIIDLALAEDIGSGDITSRSTVAADRQATASMLVKAEGIVFGIELAKDVFQRVDATVGFEIMVPDGSRVSAGTIVAAVQGNARSILLAERVALNFIQRLSGVATITAAYVSEIAGTDARIVDTRKTTPGLRVLEKAAVRAGGAHNHRFGLSDGVLIKDNHLLAVGGPDRVSRSVAMARNSAPHTLAIEVEVTSMAEVREALAAGANTIMLDNMSVAEMREAVAFVAGRALLEASGGITLANVADVARTGVDLISIGALTHSAPSLDISLDFAMEI